MIEFDNPYHGEILTRELDPDQPFRVGFDRCISVTHAGKLVGGVTYDGFLRRSIHMHVASFRPSFLSRDFLFVVFDYPFNQLGVEVVYGLVASTNVRAVVFDRRIGFVDEAVLKGACVDGDLLILSMRRHQCRWLNYKPRSIKRGLNS